jgi:hypothetical protein
VGSIGWGYKWFCQQVMGGFKVGFLVVLLVVLWVGLR